MPSLDSPAFWSKACKELGSADPVMGGLIKRYKGETLTSRGDAFYTLARSIAGQQISVKAADSVWQRLENHLGGMSPAHILSSTEEELRAQGLSRQKIVYLNGIAEYFDAQTDPHPRWAKMSDEEVIKDLTALKGIGRWTAEMFLIFHLMRPDVFPLDDIGLQKAIFLHYNDKEPLPKKELTTHGEKWKPWRSVATWYLWRALDPLPVEY